MSRPSIESLETRKLYSASPAGVRDMLTDGAALDSAGYLGTFNTHSSRSTSTYLGGSDGDQAVYEIDVTAPVMLSVKLSNLRQKVQTQLLFADGSPITSTRNPYSKTEQLTQRLDPGAYYLNLITASDSSNRISLSARSTRPRFGTVAPQQPVDSVAPVDSGFSLTNPFSPTSTPLTTSDDLGAIPTGITPNSAEDLQYMGGNVIRHLNFANIYVGGYDWSSSDIQNIDSALAAAMSDPTLNTVMQQYFSGTITSNFLGSAVLSGYAPNSVSQDGVESYLASLDRAGYLSSFTLNNTVLNFMLPSGTVLSHGSANSLNGLGGFHGSVHAVNAQGGADTIYYSVGAYSENFSNGYANGIPVFDQSWKNVVGTFYHELNEARTDPDVEDAGKTNDISYCGWISNTGNEIGDFPIFEANNAGLPLTSVFCEVPLSDGSGTVPIQLMWSNQAHAPVDPTGQAVDTSNPQNWWDWFLKFD
jgi:hypothetical protein